MTEESRMSWRWCWITGGWHGDQELVGVLDPGMRGCSYVVVFGLISAYQWAGSGARVSDCRDVEVLELVCWPAGLGPGPSGSQDRVLGQL